jgi:hypothetical protein
LKRTEESIKYYSNEFVFNRQTLIYIGLWFVITFCSLTSHTVVPIPPTLILFFVGTLFLICFSRKLYISNTLILPTICVFYFFTSQTIIAAPFTRYMGVIFAIAYYIIVVTFGYQTSAEKRKLLITKFITFSSVILLIECLWRLAHPNTEYTVFEQTNDPRWIYQYKFGGLMYVDSNAVAIHIIIVLFFIFYMELEHRERWTKTKLLLIILLVLTFSRAGWVGAFLGWIYIRFLRKQKLEFYIVNLVAFSLILVVF